jgi:hypothetical protein
VDFLCLPAVIASSNSNSRSWCRCMPDAWHCCDDCLQHTTLYKKARSVSVKFCLPGTMCTIPALLNGRSPSRQVGLCASPYPNAETPQS